MLNWNGYFTVLGMSDQRRCSLSGRSFRFTRRDEVQFRGGLYFEHFQRACRSKKVSSDMNDVVVGQETDQRTFETAHRLLSLRRWRNDWDRKGEQPYPLPSPFLPPIAPVCPRMQPAG